MKGKCMDRTDMSLLETLWLGYITELELTDAGA
jgi:hypothetical protein